ncbi:hypothetical protein [Bordetella sp. LUAb4]|uniref:hypothetical protein n=1 Tax=Bordetella sp. LUAb4 TaxID=2843195 RepID=UPI001E38287A|nr:hypothetical protein [Bordetella sp. LUAb4]
MKTNSTVDYIAAQDAAATAQAPTSTGGLNDHIACVGVGVVDKETGEKDYDLLQLCAFGADPTVAANVTALYKAGKHSAAVEAFGAMVLHEVEGEGANKTFADLNKGRMLKFLRTEHFA